jgi:amidase
MPNPSRRSSLAAGLFWALAVAVAPLEAQTFEVHEATILEIQQAMIDGRITSVELVDAYLERIRGYDLAGPSLNSILYVSRTAREDAAALDRERAEGRVRGPLHGVPVLLKDNYDTHDMPTTAGSMALAGVVPPTDATVVRQIREAGAVILGKTNLHEWAYGYTTISSLGGQTLNPYDPGRIAGGSSGGTGAAIAASLAAIGWGTDTCGSIRVPAALNGLFGLRSTKGLASVHGIIPLAHTQDVPGPLARTVTDLAIGLDVTVGADPLDPATSILQGRELPRFVEALDEDALRGARIGILTNYFGNAPEDREVGDLVREAITLMSARGAVVIDVTFPAIDSILDGTSVIQQEFEADLVAYLHGNPSSPWKTLEEIVESGLYHPAVAGSLARAEAAPGPDSPQYRAALDRRARAREAVIAFLDAQDLDALAYPSVRRPPGLARDGQLQQGVACQLSSGTGLPALTVPAGRTEDGLPAGFEILGRPFDDARLVAIAYSYERAFSPRVPPRLTPPVATMSP